MKSKIFTLIMFLAVFGIAQGQVEFLKTAAAPTIDGVIDSSDPWGADNWKDIVLETGTSTGATSKFQLLHDDDNLYFAVEVDGDLTPNNTNTTTYENDVIELFLHMSDVNTPLDYTASTYQFRWQRDEATIANDGGGSNYATLVADAGYEYMTVASDNGYVMECTIPILAADAAATFNDVDFFMDWQIADCTTGTGREYQLWWGDNSNEQWHDVTVFTASALVQTEISTGIQTVENQIGSVYVANDMLNFVNAEGAVSIYSISGALVMQTVVERNGSMDISSLNTGIYIVKTSEFKAKIIK